jgi:hypothetical protein
MSDDVEKIRKVYCIYKTMRNNHLDQVEYWCDIVREITYALLAHNKKKKLLRASRALHLDYSTKLTKYNLCHNIGMRFAYLLSHWDWHKGIQYHDIHYTSIDSAYEAYQIVMILSR